jgi:hypothetical protein
MSLPDIDVCPALIYYILYAGSSFCLYGHGIFVFCSMYYNKICDNLHFFFCLDVFCIFTKEVVVVVIV